MNWHNLSEEQFDQRIKDHLDGSEVTFDPASWEKMNKKLGIVFPGGQRGSILGLVLISILLSSMFFWNVSNFSINASSKTNMLVGHREIATAFSGENVSNIQAENPSSLEAEGSSAKSDVKIQSNVLNRSTQGTSSSPADKDINGEQLQSGSIANEHLISSLNQSDEGSIDTPDQKQPKRTSGNTSLLEEPAQSALSPTAKATSGLNQSEASTNKFADYRTNEVKSSGELGSPGLIGSKPANPEFLHSEELPDSVSQVLTYKPPVIKTTNSRWFVGFGYAPDISLVGFGETTSPGNSFGLSVEYQLSSRWSIQSGVTYSNKKYKAAGEDYHPPYGFWNYGDVPEETDATCDVIDIPINLKYYFNSNSRSRFYASTGLSSYLMLTEDYYYQYDGYPDPDAVESWHVSNDNQHFFGIYNLAVGYQRSIGNQWYLEIEPFIKLPLAGVGFGKVDLWSTGSIFSIKYNFK